MVWKILRKFLNTFTAYDKYSVLNAEYLTHPIHLQLSQKQNTFSEFFSAFSKSSLNFEHIEKKNLTLIANVFPKVRTFTNVAR